MGGPFDGDEIFVCVSGEFVMDLVAADETAAVHSAEKHRNGSLLRVARREIVARPMFDAVARFGRLQTSVIPHKYLKIWRNVAIASLS